MYGSQGLVALFHLILPEIWGILQLTEMGVSKNRGFYPPKSSIFKGFSIIFTIHFGGKHPYCWFNTQISLSFPNSTEAAPDNHPNILAEKTTTWVF